MSDTRCFHCGARIVAFQQTIAELKAVKRELHERDEQHRHVMGSPCPDEQHCTCVPILRREIERLEAENASYHEQMKLVGIVPCLDRIKGIQADSQENQKLQKENQQREVEIERLSSELDALRQFVEQHSRVNSMHVDGTKNYRMGGYIGRARTLWDAINRAENKTEMGDE